MYISIVQKNKLQTSKGIDQSRVLLNRRQIATERFAIKLIFMVKVAGSSSTRLVVLQTTTNDNSTSPRHVVSRKIDNYMSAVISNTPAGAPVCV